MAALVRTLKDFAIDGELKSKVVFCPRLDLFVEFDLQKDNQLCDEINNGAGMRAHGGEKRGGEIERTILREALQHPHLALYDILIPIPASVWPSVHPHM